MFNPVMAIGGADSEGVSAGPGLAGPYVLAGVIVAHNLDTARQAAIRLEPISDPARIFLHQETHRDPVSMRCASKGKVKAEPDGGSDACLGLVQAQIHGACGVTASRKLNRLSGAFQLQHADGVVDDVAAVVIANSEGIGSGDRSGTAGR